MALNGLNILGNGKNKSHKKYTPNQSRKDLIQEGYRIIDLTNLIGKCSISKTRVSVYKGKNIVSKYVETEKTYNINDSKDFIFNNSNAENIAIKEKTQNNFSLMSYNDYLKNYSSGNFSNIEELLVKFKLPQK